MIKFALMCTAAWFILGAVFYFGEKLIIKSPFHLFDKCMEMLGFGDDDYEEIEDPCVKADADWDYKLVESGDNIVEIRRENGEWKCREFVECPDIIL